MQNGDKEKPGISTESAEAIKRKNADFDFGWLVRGYLRKEGFRDRASMEALFVAIAADPSGKSLLDAKPSGNVWIFSGTAKAHFEGPISGLTDVLAGAGTTRETLVAEIVKKKREVVAEEVAETSRKTAVLKLLKSEYELQSGEVRKLETAVAKAASREVAKALRDGGKREDFLWICLGRPQDMPPKSARVERVKKISTDPKPGSAETPKDRAKRIAIWQKAILSGRLTDEQAAEIIAEFQSPEDRKILVRALIPNSNLGTLVDKGFITEKEARESVRKATEALVVQKSSGNPAFANLRTEDVDAIVADTNLKDVPVAVEDLPDAVLEGFVSDVALTGRLAAKLQEECNRSVADLVETIDGKFKVEADEDGIVASNFMKESARRLFPGRDPKNGKTGPGISDFSALVSENHLKAGGESAYVEGDCRMENGEIKRVIMKVGAWNEFSNGNKTVSVTLYENDYETEIATSEIGYADFHKLLSNFNNGSSYDRGQFESSRRRRRIEAGTAAPEELRFDTLADLQKYVDASDSEGNGLKIASGLLFQSGKPSDGEDYNLAMVAGVDERAKTVTFVSSNGSRSTVTFEIFASFFGFGLDRKNPEGQSRGKVGVHRVSGAAGSVAEVLETQKKGRNRVTYENLVYESTGGKRRIVSKNKRYEDGDHGVRVFVNERGDGVEIGDINEDGTVSLRYVREFANVSTDEKGNRKGATYKTVGAAVTKPAITLQYLIESMGLQPHDAPFEKPAERIEEVPFQNGSFFKAWFNNPSINDILKGMSRIPDVIKHRLEHSHKHHSAHMAHAIASKLPFFPESWLVDFERELYSEDKKMLDEDIDHLGGINPPRKRHEQVEKFLLDSSTTPTEVIACICVMLEKHGSLYVGRLKKYEGKWLYFSRLPGSMEQKEAFIAEQKKKYAGRHINEEFAIHEYLKIKFADLHLNPAYWKMVKDRWDKGADSEKGNGQKEVQNRPTFEGRANYVTEKFEEQEYANGIGAIEEVWNKPGAIHRRMEASFLLAITNIRENIHVSLLQKFISQFDAGHTYPPLLFIQDAGKQKLFRRVIRKCAESVGNECVKAFDEQLAPLFAGKDNNELIKNAMSFWKAYGKALTPKLVMDVRDPFVVMNKDGDTDLAEYYETVSGELGSSKMHDVEIELGLYGSDAGKVNWATINPRRYAGMIEFQSGPGNLKPGAMTEFLFGEFLSTLEAIRDTTYDTDPEKDLSTKKALYRSLHQSFQTVIIRDVSSDWWNPDASGRMRMYTHNWMQRLMRYGFTAPASKAQDNLEGETYERWLEADFARFITGNRTRGTNAARTVVARDIGEIIGNGRGRNGGNSGPNGGSGGSSGPGNPGSSGGSGGPKTPRGPEVPAAPTAPESFEGGTRPVASEETAETDSASAPKEAPARSRNPDASGAETQTSEASEPEITSPAGIPKDVTEGTERKEDEREPSAEYLRRTPEDAERIVGRIFERFGKELAMVADRETRRMVRSLETLGLSVPPEIRAGEWVLSKMAERFLELEIRNALREGTTAEDLFDPNEKYARLGSEMLRTVRTGTKIRTDRLSDSDREFFRPFLTSGDVWKPEVKEDRYDPDTGRNTTVVLELSSMDKVGRRMDSLAG